MLKKIFLSMLLFALLGVDYANAKETIIDQRNKKAVIEEVIPLDTVWAGHPVGFFLITSGQHQYISYYNAKRQMIVGSRKLSDKDWQLCEVGPAYKDTTIGWDSHNYITMAIDAQGYLHLSGNMHCTPLVYFRSEKPHDITTFKRFEMTGKDEQQCTYPTFMNSPSGELVFHYRIGKSGSGNEIYNIYDSKTKTWKRLLETPLTDGKGEMNAYMLGPKLGPDGWYHVSWVWRNTYDCSTNHDLSYMKSKDLINWFTADGKPISLPITINTKGVIVDAIPVNGGIINGSGRIGSDLQDKVVLSYHKFDKDGNTQAYLARFENGKWISKQITNWDHRWEFGGGGSIDMQVKIYELQKRNDGLLEMDYSHCKYGSGTWLIDNDSLSIYGKVLKSSRIPSEIMKAKSDLPGMKVRICQDQKTEDSNDSYYLLRWETLDKNRDLPRSGKLPEAAALELYKIRMK